MKWKEFFKPNFKKVVLAIVIFIVMSFLPVVPYYCSYFCEGCEGIELRPMIAGCEFIYLTLLVIIFEILLSYFISCLILTKRPFKK